MAQQIPWDSLVSVYSRQLNNSTKGANGINPRVAIGAIIIKHMCDLSDRETILQIQENVYMQYFIGYSSFSDEAPFDPSLFVDLRKRLGADQVNAINERIMGVMNSCGSKKDDDNQQTSDTDQTILNAEQQQKGEEKEEEQIQQSQQDVCREPKHGTLIVDATTCSQDITYPTDLNLLNDAREKSEQIIDILHMGLLSQKPRTYRLIARKEYLHTAQKKIKTKKQIRSAIRKQDQAILKEILTILDYCWKLTKLFLYQIRIINICWSFRRCMTNKKRCWMRGSIA